MKKEHRIEGVILHTLPFRDHDLILTVFSSELGIVKLIAKRFGSKKQAKGALTSPLTRAEFIYSEGKGESDLFNCKEISPLEAFLPLRKSLATLESAGKMLRAIIDSQPFQKPAPALYTLLIRYFEKLPHFPHPEILVASFLLKILHYEGLSDFSSESPPFPISLWATFQQLALSQTFKQLGAIPFSPEIEKEAHAYFIWAIRS